METENAKVSVIIPVYNVKDYLERCVDSVLAQTYSDLEVWLVDDGSTDGSSDICDSYAAKDERVNVLHQENRGLSSARNAALNHIGGKYVTFIDSDDYICEGMISALADAVRSSESDIAVCLMEQGGADTFSADGGNGILKVLSGDDLYAALFDSASRGYMHTVCGKMYRSNIFSKIRFPEGRIHEDEFVIHHILGECKKGAIISKKLYYHFRRNDSITRSGYSCKSLDAVDAMEDRCMYFEKMGNLRLIQEAYREFMRSTQFHYYSMKKYYPNETEKTDFILQRYKEYYDKIFSDMNTYERLRYGLFIYCPSLNRLIKSMAGARKI